MCKCNPSIRTPFCGKLECQWPEQETVKTEPKIDEVWLLRAYYEADYPNEAGWRFIGVFGSLDAVDRRIAELKTDPYVKKYAYESERVNR